SVVGLGQRVQGKVRALPYRQNLRPDYSRIRRHRSAREDESKMPMLLALLPAASADRLRANPAEAETLLMGSPCKQRAVQNADFTCKLNKKDGIQQVVLMPEPGLSVPKGKKVEVQVTTVRCVANCTE